MLTNKKGTKGSFIVDTSNKGSTFDVDLANRILKFRIWGLWEEEELKAWQQEFKVRLQTLGSGAFSVYVHMADFPPQRPDISKGLQEIMALALRAGMVRASHLVSRTMTELQIKRLSDEVGAPNFRFFKTEKEAIDWLLTSK